MKKVFKFLKSLKQVFTKLIKFSRIGVDVSGDGKPDIFIDFDPDRSDVDDK